MNRLLLYDYKRNEFIIYHPKTREFETEYHHLEEEPFTIVSNNMVKFLVKNRILHYIGTC